MRRSEWSEEQRIAFGRALYRKRVARGLTPEELAMRINEWLAANKNSSGRQETVTDGTIRKYEDGKHVPSVKKRQAFGAILAFDVQSVIENKEELIGRADDKPSYNREDTAEGRERRLTDAYGPVIEDFLRRPGSQRIENFERFVGSYLVFRHSFDPNKISVVWLEIRDIEEKMKVPHYRIFQRSGMGTVLEGDGFVIASRTHLTCVGHRGDADLEMAILNRIDGQVKFLSGIALTSTRDRHSFAANIYCDRVSDKVGIEKGDYDQIIRPMEWGNLKEKFMGMGRKKEELDKIMFYIDNSPKDNAKVLYGRTPKEKSVFDAY